MFGIVNEETIDNEEEYRELIKCKDNILEMLPKFVYYASYANLSSDLYLSNIINDLGRYDSLSEKAKNRTKTLKVLFDFVNLSSEEILDLGGEATASSSKSDATINEELENKKEREILLDSASASMTRSFKEWWKQGNYVFKFSADGELSTSIRDMHEIFL